MNSLTRELKLFTDYIETQNGETETEDGRRKEGDCWRLNWHVMPLVGWLNDPNGLCWLNGAYHLFFQYSPAQAQGGLKYWGHYTGKDLIHWDYQGIALYPDMPFDCHGVYSGSALVEDNRAYLYYTGNVKLSGDYDYIYDGREGNTVLAVMEPDGKIGEKHLLLKNSDYPRHLSCHVRDPKVWKTGDVYYMVLGARTKSDQGCVLLYSSLDRLNWFLKNILESDNQLGYMWECPDLYVLGGQTILSFSPQGVEQSGWDFANVYQSGYCLMKGDFTGAYSLGPFKEYDRGFDFYAPQTFEDRDGRRILIGWMGMPDCDYINPTVSRGWQHCMTMPRVLTFKDNQIYQQPVKEMAQLRREKSCFDYLGDTVYTYNAKNGCELQLHIMNLPDHPGSRNFRLIIDRGLELAYDHNKHLFTMTFTDDETGRALGSGRTVRGVELECLERVQIFLDTSAIEVFLNGGREVFSSRLYSEDGTHKIDFMEGCMQAVAWKLEG